MGHRSVLNGFGSRVVLALLATLVGGGTAAAQVGSSAGSGPSPLDSLEVRVWLDRGDDPVVEVGDEVRVYYRVSSDAHVAIFRIDTEGRVSLLSPQHPAAETLARGGREYRLLLTGAARWQVTDQPGEGFFFAVASDEPLDFSLFEFHSMTGWDVSGAGADAYDDPYQAIDDYVVALLPSWESVPYALDLLPYEVAEEASGTAMHPYWQWEEGDTARVYDVPGPYPAPRMRLRTWYPPHLYLPAPRPRYPPPPARYAAPPARYAPPPARYAPPPPRYAPCCRPPGRARPPRSPTPYPVRPSQPSRRRAPDPGAPQAAPRRGRPPGASVGPPRRPGGTPAATRPAPGRGARAPVPVRRGGL